MLQLLPLIVCVAAGPPDTLQSHQRGVVELLEHALRSMPGDVHLEEVIVGSTGRQVRGVVASRAASEGFVEALAIDHTHDRAGLDVPGVWAESKADHHGVPVMRLWAFQGLGGTDPSLAASGDAARSLQNSAIAVYEVRRYGHDVVAEGAAASREDLGQWLELLQHSPCLGRVDLQQIEEPADSEAVLFWISVHAAFPFAPFGECAPDPVTDDSARLTTLVAGAEEAGFAVVVDQGELTPVLHTASVEIRGEQDALRSWLATAELPPVRELGMRQEPTCVVLDLDLRLRRPADGKALRKTLRWHERRVERHEAGESEPTLGGILFASMSSRLERDALQTLLQLERDMVSLHELEGKEYTSPLPDDLENHDARQQDEWRLDLMMTATNLVKRDATEPAWNSLDHIAGRLALADVRTRPLAPLVLSTYLVGYPVQVEARGDPEQLAEYVQRLGRLSQRSDRSHLHVTQTDSGGVLTGAIVFVCGRQTDGRAPDLTRFVGMTTNVEHTGRDPFAISPRLQEALATQAQLAPAVRYPVTAYVLVRVAPGGIAHVRDMHEGEEIEVRVGDRLGTRGDTVLEIESERMVLVNEVEDPIEGGTIRYETEFTRQP